MRRWNALIFAVSVASIATPLPVLGETGAGHLFDRTDFVRFEIILGRITAQNACHGKARIATQGDLEAGNGEVLTLRVMEGVPRIRYELRRDNQSYAVTAIGADRILIERRTAAPHESVVRYEQHSQGDVKLSLSQDGLERVATAPSLWHLWLRNSELCELELLPCLQILRSNWRMEREIRELESALFDPMVASNANEYRTWLNQLADDRFKVRQTAFRKFKAAGVGAKAFLESIDRRQLDGEQRMRVHQLKQSLCFRTADSPARVANWLKEDRRVWFAYLNDPQRAKRSMACAHLERICGDRLSFDPEGSADTRATQIATLHARVFR